MSKSGLELLNKIFLSAGEGIVLVNAKGVIIMANKRALDLFEYKREELLGKEIEILIPDSFRKRHQNHRNKYLKNPVSRPMGSGLDLVGQKKSGNTFPLEVSLSHVTHQSEMIVVAFITDISARKEQERALNESKSKLQEYAHELESKVSARTKELEHLNLGLKSQIRERKLAEAALQVSLEEVKKAEKEISKALEKEKEVNEMKSRFISMASHEFRTPLTTVLSSANLISKYKEESQHPKREKHINRIRTSVQNLTNILNDFLSLDKLDTGALSFRPGEFNFEEELKEIIESLELVLKKEQTLVQDIAEPIGVIYTDPHLIKNIILNLLSNAIKYSPEGKTITLRASRTDSHLEILVRDEGIGIPEEEQKNLFQRFYRANNATNIQGTGLGLNIVKRYLDLIGGEIKFQSKEGKGSEFIINFPIKK